MMFSIVCGYVLESIDPTIDIEDNDFAVYAAFWPVVLLYAIYNVIKFVFTLNFRSAFSKMNLNNKGK